MTVNGAQHPEQRLGLEEIAAVTICLPGTKQQRTNFADARTTIRLVPLVRRRTRRLAHILLGQAQPPLPVARRLSVESLYDQHVLVVKVHDLAFGDWQSELPDDLRTQPLVLDRRRQVGLHVSDTTKRQLEDVGCRRRTCWPPPPAVVVQECRLFLSAR